MTYFKYLLNGNIPIDVIDAAIGFQSAQRLNKQFNYYKLIEGMTDNSEKYPIDEKKILSSVIGKCVTKSINIDKNKIKMGLMKIIYNALDISLNMKKNDLIKFTEFKYILTPQNKQFINNTITQIVHSIVESINMQTNFLQKNEKNSIMLLLLCLSGIIEKQNCDKYLNSIMLELGMQSKLYIPLKFDMHTSLKLKLTPDAIRQSIQKCSIISIKCLFDEAFISYFAEALLMVLDSTTLLILKNAKTDSVCDIYNKTINLLNDLSNISTIEPSLLLQHIKHPIIATVEQPTSEVYEPNLSAHNSTNQSQIISEVGQATNKVIEKFLDAGNSTKLSDSTTIRDLKEINKNIDQSKVINGMAKIVSDAINEVVSSNTADLLRTISASNKLSFKNLNVSGDIKITNIKQVAQIDTTVQANFVQSITSKIQNDIASKIAEKVDTSTKEYMSDIKKLTSDEKVGSSLEGILGQLSGIGESMAKTLSISCGNSVNQSTSRNIDQEMKETYNLNQSFHYDKTDDAKNAVSNVLKPENLAKCAADSSATNDIPFENINITGSIEVDNITQESVVKDVMNCVFNQTVVTDIATKIFADFNKLITAMIENVNETLDEQQKTKVQGDIYAAGTAAADMLGGVGTAAQGVGTGVGSAAKGIGEGIGNILGGLMAPLIAGGVLIALLIVVFIIYKIYFKKSDDDEESDEESDFGDSDEE